MRSIITKLLLLIVFLLPILVKAQRKRSTELSTIPQNLHVDSILELPTHTESMRFLIPAKITVDIEDYGNYTVGNHSYSRNDKKSDFDRYEKSDKRRDIRFVRITDNSIPEYKEMMVQAYDHVDLESPLVKFAHQNGYIDTINSLLTNAQTNLYLYGKITSIYSFYSRNISSNAKYMNKVYMTWYVYNAYHECFDSIQIVRYAKNHAPSKYEVPSLDDAIKECYIALINHPAITPYLKIDTSNLNLQLTTLQLPIPNYAVKSIDDALLASVTIKRSDEGHGSGFAISNDGYILTNYHVIAGKIPNQPDSFRVLTPEGTEIEAHVVRTNKLHDLALIKVDYSFKSAFQLIPIKSYNRTMEIFTVGTPSSIDLEKSISKGILSNERQTGRSYLLQLGISLNAGNSGGPVFDKTGMLHGVVVSKLVGFATEGVSFAIPAHMISTYLNLELK